MACEFKYKICYLSTLCFSMSLINNRGTQSVALRITNKFSLAALPVNLLFARFSKNEGKFGCVYAKKLRREQRNNVRQIFPPIFTITSFKAN